MERSGRFQESSGEGHAEEGHRSLGCSLGFERAEEMEEEGKKEGSESKRAQRSR